MDPGGFLNALGTFLSNMTGDSIRPDLLAEQRGEASNK